MGIFNYRELNPGLHNILVGLSKAGLPVCIVLFMYVTSSTCEGYLIFISPNIEVIICTL